MPGRSDVAARKSRSKAGCDQHRLQWIRSARTPSRAIERTLMDMERNVAANGRTTGDPGDPCVMVIFGASGDLTKRKLIPALYNLAKDNLLSREFALVGFSRPDWTHDQFREKCSDDLRQFATGHIDPDIWHWFARRMLHTRRHRRAGRVSAPEGDARRRRPGARHARQLSLLSGDRAQFLLDLRPSGRRSRAGVRGQRPVAARDHREAVRSRPRIGAGAQRRRAAGAGRIADLPDRSLSRQGDGPEHPGLPLRQRHLRADLEPQLHRSHPDHRGGDASASRRAAVTTRPRARCATWCRTTCSS